VKNWAVEEVRAWTTEEWYKLETERIDAGRIRNQRGCDDDPDADDCSYSSDPDPAYGDVFFPSDVVRKSLPEHFSKFFTALPFCPLVFDFHLPPAIKNKQGLRCFCPLSRRLTDTWRNEHDLREGFIIYCDTKNSKKQFSESGLLDHLKDDAALDAYKMDWHQIVSKYMGFVRQGHRESCPPHSA
jgi:hypothetical protein